MAHRPQQNNNGRIILWPFLAATNILRRIKGQQLPLISAKAADGTASSIPIRTGGQNG